MHTMVLQRQRLSAVICSYKNFLKEENRGSQLQDLIQSNPIKGWIQSMSNSDVTYTEDSCSGKVKNMICTTF